MGGHEVVIVDGVRTPVGKLNGQLKGWHPTDLLAETFASLVARTGVDPSLLADVIVGCVLSEGEQSFNIARFAALGAGLPESVPGVTIDRQCGSGQQAVHFAAQEIGCGDAEFVIAGGVESMSRVPLGPMFDPSMGEPTFYGDQARARYKGALGPQGHAVEMFSRRWGLTREELDEYSIESHRRADAAFRDEVFAGHLVPIRLEDGSLMVRDEGIRASIDASKVAALNPVFVEDGIITAANSSQLSDGAAALLLAERGAAQKAGLRAVAVIRAMSVAADDPILQFTAILPATEAALSKAGLSMDDIDLVEVNEAFAAVPLVFAREFGLSMDKVNVNGGSIAMGHPLGSTGARLMVDLVHELRRTGGRFGLLTVCEGGGMANSTVVEMLT